MTITTNLKHLYEIDNEKWLEVTIKYVRQKTGFSVEFPDECPYNFKQLLDIAFLNEL